MRVGPSRLKARVRSAVEDSIPTNLTAHPIPPGPRRSLDARATGQQDAINPHPQHPQGGPRVFIVVLAL